MEFRFTRVTAATPPAKVADCTHNSTEIISIINKVSGSDIILFPELSITSCSCSDLFTQSFFLKQAEGAMLQIANASSKTNCIIVVGMPVKTCNKLYNCAVVVHKGEIKGATAKTTLTAEEKRWFSPGNTLPAGATTTLCGKATPIGCDLIYSTQYCKFAVEIGSDLLAPIPTSSKAALCGAEIILNPAAIIAQTGGNSEIKECMTEQSKRCICAYAHANAGYGESTSKGVYSGYNAICEAGEMLASNKPFKKSATYSTADIDIEKLQEARIRSIHFAAAGCCNSTIIEIDNEEPCRSETLRTFAQSPFFPIDGSKDSIASETFIIQSMALAKRIEHTYSKSCVIGISGGLDSTLALLVTAKACDIIGKPHSDIIAVTMPGFGTSGRTYENAIKLMKDLGVTIKEISIKEACLQHFKDINHNPEQHDITYENSQARERTQILMDIANQYNGIVIGTGDLSELALGWATYNGDHMSMYSVNASVPKTVIQEITKYIAANSDGKIKETLLDIVGTPISPELTPADNQGNIKQKTEDLVGPYELHDFFIYHFLCHGCSPAKIYMMAQKAFEGKHDKETIKKWLTTFFRRFFTQQFKRSCSPDSPRTGPCNVSPQGGWSMPSDTCYRHWIEECEKLK